MLISYLSVRVTHLPFKNFEELLSKSDYKLVIPPGTAVVDFFKTNTNPILHEVWKTRIEPHYLDYQPETVFSITEHLLTGDSKLAVIEFFPFAAYK